MAKTKYYNKNTKHWEYAETGCIPVRGVHYWIAQDLKPLHDYISSRVMATAEVCFLTVGVTSNQSDKSALEGLALSVTFPDGRAAEVEAGSAIAFTEGSVTVQFPEVTGYKRPDNISVSYAKGSVTETATYLAEEVTVNALVDGAASSEFSYEVSGEGIVCLTGSGTSFTGVTKWLVPHGVTITVTPSAVDGYTTSAVTHTASGVTGSVSVEWAEVRLGVFIEDINGKLWTSDAWDGSATPNGVAVCTENCRFVMALESSKPSVFYWGGYLTEVSGILTSEDATVATSDYAGKSNTLALVEALAGVNDGYADGAPAAEYSQAYTFPNGNKGYMGAAGEWNAVLNNISEVLVALNGCGGSAIESSYWTSTQSSSSLCWFFFGNENTLGKRGKNARDYVRPFTTLKMDTI